MERAGAGAPHEQALRRDLGPWLGTLIVVNAMIGTGIFKSPAAIARDAGATGPYLAVWIAGGVIALAGALSLAELGAAMPRTGGLYEYLRRGYGDTVAFLFGWVHLTLVIPASVGSFGRVAAEGSASLFGLAPDRTRDGVIAVGVVVVCAALNLGRVRRNAITQGVVSAAKYGGVVLLAVLGLALGHAPAATSAPVHSAGWFAALVGVMWVYDGWADLTRVAGETRAPERTLPRALIGGVAAVLAVYLIANAGYLVGIGLDGLRGTGGDDIAATRLATSALGAAGRSLVSALIVVSCVGACLATLLTNSRTFVPLATDRLFFARLGEVSPRSGNPTIAVLVCAILGVAYVLSRSFEQLTDAIVVGEFPFYALAVAAVLVLRRREPDLARPFRVPGYPVVPLVFLAGATALVVGAIGNADPMALYALAVVIAGLPVHLAWRRFR